VVEQEALVGLQLVCFALLGASITITTTITTTHQPKRTCIVRYMLSVEE
jgi:hypothetical protein